MVKVTFIESEKETEREMELPECFAAPVRVDIIRKVYRVLALRKKQPYGTWPLAGKKGSGKVSHRRRVYKTLYGRGISRVPRKIMYRRGELFIFRGAFAPGTRGGRAAHPPKATKRLLKVNKKEARLALKGAIAATASPEWIKEKYNIELKQKLPFVLSSKELEKSAKELAKLIFRAIPIKPAKKVRAGKGKLRGRKYKYKNKILLVSTASEPKLKLAQYGIEQIKLGNLNLLKLAQGGQPGQLVVWTEKAIQELKNLK